jgi:hypothetical protein
VWRMVPGGSSWTVPGAAGAVAVLSAAFWAADTGDCENSCERRVKAKADIARIPKIKSAVGKNPNFLSDMHTFPGSERHLSTAGETLIKVAGGA